MSIEDQITRCREFAATRGWTVVQTIEEPGDTGSRVLYRKTAHGVKFQPRPGIRRLLDLAEAGEIDVVLATVQDRYHRNEYEFEQLLREHLQPHGVTCWTLAGPLSDDTPFDWQARKAEGNYAEMHSRITSYKLRESNKLARRRGDLISGRPFGTKSVPGSRQRVRDPQTWPVLEEIFQRSADGEPHLRIARDLTARGVPTVDGGKWHQATIRGIVACVYYIGQLMHKGELVLDDKGQPLTKTHDCMIAPELWKTAQVPRRIGRPASVAHNFLLHGLVVSSHFELDEPERYRGQWAPYARRMSKGKPVYRASHNDNPYYSAHSVDDLAEQMPLTLPAGELERIVVERLIQAARDEEVVRMILESAELEAAQRLSQTADLQEQYNALAREIKKSEQLLLNVMDGGLTEAVRVMDAKLAALRQEHDALAAELDRAYRYQHSSANEVEAARMVNRVEECWNEGNHELLREIIHALVEFVDVRVDGIQLIMRCDTPRLSNVRRALVITFAQALRRHCRLPAAVRSHSG